MRAFGLGSCTRVSLQECSTSYVHKQCMATSHTMCAQLHPRSRSVAAAHRCQRQRPDYKARTAEADSITATTASDMRRDAASDSPVSASSTEAPLMTMGVDASMPGSLDPDFNVGCRVYYFGEDQRKVITQLRESMSSCATAFSGVAVTNVLLSCVQAWANIGEEAGPATIFNGLTVGDVAYWADSLILVLLLKFALEPFDTVLGSRSQQMARTFQGVNRLGLIFQQLSIGSLAVTTVTALEAAVKYPPIVVFSSGLFFAVAMLRAVAMWWVLKEHTSSQTEVIKTLGVVRAPADASRDMPLLDRWAVWLAFGYLLQFEEKAKHGSGSDEDWVEDNNGWHYEFSVAEERILKSMVESASTAGLALAVQALATAMLAIAEFGLSDWPGVISNGINFTNKGLMAVLIFEACQSFDRALHTVGSDDVDHLMNGLGENGLTETFNKLSILAWAVSIAATVGLAAPWLEHNAALTAMSDLGTHRTVEAVLEVVKDTAKIARGI